MVGDGNGDAFKARFKKLDNLLILVPHTTRTRVGYAKFLRAMLGVDLFAGAGGMTLGAKLAGINVKFAVESDPEACNTYTHNHTDTKLFSKDIRELKEMPFNREANQRLVVFGGPPCQGFSTSNRRTRNKSNSNNWLFEEFVRVVRLFNPLPDWVVFENVRGFSETESSFFLESVLQELNYLGYSTSHSILNAVDYGVPQRRRRFFAVGRLNNVPFKFPEKYSDKPYTVYDAIGDLPILEPGNSETWLSYLDGKASEYAKDLRGHLTKSPNHQVTRNSQLILDRYKYISQGGNWQQIPKELLKNYKDVTRCHTGIYYRLKESEPSIVIGNFRKNMLIHPTQDRGLSVREAARLQSFPDWYEFKGSIGFQQQQVGNAVPPLLAKAIFESIVNNSQN